MPNAMTATELLEMFRYLSARGARASVLSRVEREYSEALCREWQASK